MRKFNVVQNTLYCTEETKEYTLNYGANKFMVDFGIWDLKVTTQEEVNKPNV